MALTHPGWRSPPLVVAGTFLSRLRGMGAVPTGHGLLLRRRSVQTFSVPEPLGMAGITGGGVVVWAREVPPRRVVPGRGAAWIVELPPGAPLPAPGRRLTVLPIVGPCPAP